MRPSSSANMKRFSKTFSVMMLPPSAIDMSAIHCAWRSVGNPGYGSVWTSTPSSRPSRWTHAPSPKVATPQPASASLASTSSRCAGSNPVTVTGPPTRAAPTRKVPASIRSPTVRCSTARSSSTPSISRVGVPTPVIFAPIAFRNSIRSTISGSRAAFCTTVVPFASTEAVSRFSVAPTLGNSSVTFAARRPPSGAMA